MGNMHDFGARGSRSGKQSGCLAHRFVCSHELQRTGKIFVLIVDEDKRCVRELRR
jgi:hypothetical protein